jgi:two-component system, NtrC family, response regulator HydG
MRPLRAMQLLETPCRRGAGRGFHKLDGLRATNRTVYECVLEGWSITATLPTMEGELLAVRGPRVCERFPLGAAETGIGRSPQSAIHLDDPGIAWEHCVVQLSADRYRIVDRRTATGTFVNGKRILEHTLEPGDQVSIGGTVLLYREESAVQAGMPAPQVLLRTCALQFLFRALASSESPAVRGVVETQLLRLIGDLAPVIGGAVLLGHDVVELRAASELRDPASPLISALAEQVCREGPIADAATGYVAVPLYVRGEIAGLIAAHFPPPESARLREHADTLAAIATLGAMALETVREVERLNTEKALLIERLDESASGIVGTSAALQKLMQMVGRVAASDASVLLLGESGTGKEMVAQAIHRSSARAGRAFVAINCAALTETLLESELFGHEKGAFTGASAQKKGKLEMAEGGTVFLDEIGELAAALQAKLLRVLQQREFERVGGTRTLKLDLRLIAATNRDLAAEVRRGAFREDLYHRLNVVALQLPPLRERSEDIPALAAHFLERTAARCGRRVRAISPEALVHLTAYPWPGNVRELENAIERAVVLGQSETLLAEDLPETVLDAPAPQALGGLQTSVTDVKRQLIMRAWEESGGDYKLAAAKLSIHPNSLIRLIRTLGLRESLR